MKRLLALTSLLLGMADAAGTLRIYPDFAEVRVPLAVSGSRLYTTFTASAWENMVSDSWMLSETPRMVTEGEERGWLKLLEGKQLSARLDGAWKPVTLVRARDLLVKYQGGYRNVSYGDLLFPSIPPLNAQQPGRYLDILLPSGPRREVMLSYMTSSFTWYPRYELSLTGGGRQTQGRLRGLAMVSNASDDEVKVSGAELYAGEVRMAPSPPSRVPYAPSAEAADTMSPRPSSAPVPMPPRVIASGNQGGLYRYDMTGPFTLKAGTTITLPFASPTMKRLERVDRLETYFSPDESVSSGNLQRDYLVVADARLPAGTMTVRESGRVVGQTKISDTRAGGRIEFSLGADPDVSYVRSVEDVTRKSLLASKIRTYKVRYAVRSQRNVPLRVEISEFVDRAVYNAVQPLEVKGKDVVVTFTPQRYRASMKFDLPANGQVVREFEVNVRTGVRRR